jgi:hypothetical protein
MRGNLHCVGFGDAVLDITPKEQKKKKKKKIDKLDFIKIKKKNFCASKDIVNKEKKVTHRMRGNLCKFISDKD